MLTINFKLYTAINTEDVSFTTERLLAQSAHVCKNAKESKFSRKLWVAEVETRLRNSELLNTGKKIVIIGSFVWKFFLAKMRLKSALKSNVKIQIMVFNRIKFNHTVHCKQAAVKDKLGLFQMWKAMKDVFL